MVTTEGLWLKGCNRGIATEWLQPKTYDWRLANVGLTLNDCKFMRRTKCERFQLSVGTEVVTEGNLGLKAKGCNWRATTEGLGLDDCHWKVATEGFETESFGLKTNGN